MGFAKWHLVGHVGEKVVIIQRPGLAREGVLQAIDTAAAQGDEPEQSIAVLEVPQGAGEPFTVLIALEAIDSCETRRR